MTIARRTTVPPAGEQSEQTVREVRPWRDATRDVLANRAALVALIILVIIVLVSLLAPLYASHVAHTNPFTSNVQGSIVVDGKKVDVMQQSATGLGVTPIGPTWHSRYFLGADGQGRDVMARVLYGGRVSLLIGSVSAAICCFVATALGIIAGYMGGLVDGILSRLFDVVWAFPVYLLAICLSIVLLTSTLTIGPISIGSGSLALPIAIISVIYVPYVARPIRAQVKSLRERMFIQAARSVGSSNWRIIRRDVLPNVLPSVIVYFPIMMALNILIAASLSFLGVGVQPPRAAWGTIINDGLPLLYTRPLVSLAPGVMIALTCVALNLLGDSLRDALDPGSKVRVGS
ncbi:ABC transporter permease [Leekyejoonella antrihumi]|uniref:ABC transporter permease n=1 Tax=Leekyejoonella antrihumi TaxID=1660198 RepID=A0A563DZT9_9MICO|nr:ABC transporter permease [Leekyejoonella antrihumi]TWP35154.1 ABC transporter permease [Leekyejoonella antrihumi]